MRFHMQMDVKEKEILEKEVKKELEGIARGMARATMKDELEKEINRLVDAKLLDARKGEYYSSIIGAVSATVSRRIANDIKLDSATIDRIIEDKVASYIDNKMKLYGSFDKYIEAYVNKSIANLLTSK